MYNFCKEESKDQTMFGEFICSYYKWLPLDKQKENSKKLDSITKRKFN